MMIDASTDQSAVPPNHSTHQAASAFEMILETDVPVAMRDGVRLVTDIYRPALQGRPVESRFPVILERTPYDKRKVSRGEIDRDAQAPMSRAEVARYFVERGYVVVYQDCRGRGGSEGHFVKYLAEGQDGADTVAWLVEQPWCNGRVGMMGLSYAAHTQVATGCLAPPGLRAMVVDCGGFSSGYHSGMRQGGALELRQATWAFSQAKESPLAKADPLVRAALDAEDIGAWFNALPWKPGHSPLKWVPEYEEYLFEQWRNGIFNDYWKKSGIYARGSYPALSTIPQIHLTGWYDTYIATAIENYLGVAGEGQADVELIIGPWTHGDRALTYAGDVSFGPQSSLDSNLASHWRALRLQWFDRHLKDVHNDERTVVPPIRFFVMGGGSGRRDEAGRLQHGGLWAVTDSWPPQGSRETTFFLGPDGSLSGAPTERESGALCYQFDPGDPVPTIGGAFSSGAPLFYAGAFDQREEKRFFGCSRVGMPLSARSDILVFQTDPLEADTVIVGPVSVDLWISSDAPDTDFTAKLIDQYPPSSDDPRGFAMNLTDGILRCRYRDSWEDPQLMQEDTIYKIRIELPATANLFKAGHRIRLDISSSNFPKFDINPNSGEPEAQGSLRQVATNTIHVSSSFQSRLVVHTIEPNVLQRFTPT